MSDPILKIETLERVTQDDLDEMARAWATWERIQGSLVAYQHSKAQAKGTWFAGVPDFFCGADSKGLTWATIEAHDDGEWDSGVCFIPPEELLNLQALYQQNMLIATTIAEQRALEAKERHEANMLKEYERLKAIYGEGGPM